jgi:putative endonuclease
MSTERYYWVYILASGLGGTLYIGVTNNLVRRMYEHRMGLVVGFTKNRREKGLKRWNRAWKIRLIEEHNPNWGDLYPQISSP